MQANRQRARFFVSVIRAKIHPEVEIDVCEVSVDRPTEKQQIPHDQAMLERPPMRERPRVCLALHIVRFRRNSLSENLTNVCKDYVIIQKYMQRLIVLAE